MEAGGGLSRIRFAFGRLTMAVDSGDLITLRNASMRRERDFISLFNALWYRDFPIIRGHEAKAGPAMWTSHIAFVVKTCADLMGFFTLFEQGNRTDAVIQKAKEDKKKAGEKKKNYWAKVEWEWAQPFRPGVNEIKKLSDNVTEAEVFVFIGYSSEDMLAENIAKIENQWMNDEHLIVFIVTFVWKNPKRQFRTLQTYRIKKGQATKLRVQHALPWNVPGSRWQAIDEE